VEGGWEVGGFFEGVRDDGGVLRFDGEVEGCG